MSIVPSGVLHWRSIPLLHYPASCKVSLEGNILALIRTRAPWMVEPKICYALVSYDKGIFGFQVFQIAGLVKVYAPNATTFFYRSEDLSWPYRWD